MLTKTVKGIIRGGKIEPSEKLEAADGTEVTISIPALGQPAKMITFGMFAKDGAAMSTWEDFQEAKTLWEREWQRSWDRLERP